MSIRILSTAEDFDLYDKWIKTEGIGNLWQSLERKQYVESLGKEVRIYALVEDEQIRASALVVIDRTSGGFCTYEIPRGPLMDNGKLIIDNLLKHIIDDAKKDKCVALYFSPVKPIINSQLSILNSPRHIHCEATRLIDLTQSEEEILSQMKQKGRYNIKVADKHGVTVEESDDIDAWYELVQQTGKRDGFVNLPKEKYRSFLNNLPGSFMLLAYSDDTPIAGVLNVSWGERGIYYYGASNHSERAKMAPYLLQWESMRLCKAKGCTEYDLLGIAPENAPSDHPWAGITSFKEKFGGEVVTYPPERMIVLNPWMYHLLNLKRRILG